MSLLRPVAPSVMLLSWPRSSMPPGVSPSRIGGRARSSIRGRGTGFDGGFGEATAHEVDRLPSTVALTTHSVAREADAATETAHEVDRAAESRERVAHDVERAAATFARAVQLVARVAAVELLTFQLVARAAES